MVIKLVRVESTDASKITLPTGTHLFGRGKLLNVDDKRVSRKHGELQVKDDKLIVKALHQNPCFYSKKNQSDVQVLKCNCEIGLSSGDRFGLLPDSLWFEIIAFPDTEETNCENDIVSSENTDNYDATMDRTFANECPDSPVLDLEQVNCMGEKENAEATEVNEEANINEENTSAQDPEPDGSVSPKEKAETESNDESNADKENISAEDQELDRNESSRENAETDIEEPKSPQKRRHSTDEDVAKRVKVEPADVKQEPADAQAGPSANNGDSNANNAMAPSPQKPQNILRERCYYGAACYRRNPLHLSQFSHPRDPDWGPGDKGQCPFGAQCCKRDSKHWDTHTHPPGTNPPPPAAPHQGGQRKVKKRKSTSSDDSSPQKLIVQGKRKRKTVQRYAPSSESESEEDPWGSDVTDEWEPGSD